MRKLEKTRRTIHNYFTQIEYMRTSGSILYDANYLYFQEWLKRNNPMINQLSTALAQMDEKYFQHEKREDTIIFATDENKQYILNEGMTREDWQVEYDALLDVPAVIYV